MGDELTELVEFFKKVREAGGQATLSATTNKGQTKIKFEIVSPPATAPPPLQPVPGQARRRHRGAAARARRRQRAADHQGTTLAAPAPVSQPPAPPAPGEVSAPAGPHHDHLPQRRPLFPIFLPSPSPSTGRRRVMSLARLPLSSFGSLNIDGHPPSPPPSAAAVIAASYVAESLQSARSGGQPPVHAAPARVLPNTSARPPGPLLPPRTGRAILRSTQMSASSDQSSSSRATSLRRQDFILSSRKALSRPVYGRINIHTLIQSCYRNWIPI